MSNKLELTWYGKDKEIKIEPRILIENKELSNTDKDSDTQNMLIHGDNLLALKALEKEYSGKIKCIYIDPPYNIAVANPNYNDNLEHSEWLNLMRPRLEILNKLLSEDGIIFIQIDDYEMAYLKVLLDEVFLRKNYLNTVTIKMKNIAGASGGGEDKRLKKNVEYLLIYTKEIEKFKWLNNAYSYTEISDLVENYRKECISWKYTSVLYDKGIEEYIGSTVDGFGNEIKIYNRKNYKFLSISKIMKLEGLTEKEVYYKYIDRIHTTAMPQSSIRPRIMERLKDENHEELISIKYIPVSGKNKGEMYEQFYKGKKFRLLTWLKDVIEEHDGQILKKDMQGTYWDGFNLNNLTKEGQVVFPMSKKPEAIIERILFMSTEEGDIVLDSFLGSGTTSAVAHKMKRKWIGIELGEHAYSLCKKRLDNVISGSDQGGISKSTNWKGGGGYKFYELAPTLINEDKFGEPIINKDYSPDMLASAVALHEGFKYQPSEDIFWKQSKNNENSYLFVTTRHIDADYINTIKDSMDGNEYLIIACKSYDKSIEYKYPNIKIKKIPQMLLDRCEFGIDNYNLNIINPPIIENEEEDDEE